MFLCDSQLTPDRQYDMKKTKLEKRLIRSSVAAIISAAVRVPVTSLLIWCTVSMWLKADMADLSSRNTQMAYLLLLFAVLSLALTACSFWVLCRNTKKGRQTIEALRAQGLLEQAAQEYLSSDRIAFSDWRVDFRSLLTPNIARNILTPNFIFIISDNSVIAYDDVVALRYMRDHYLDPSDLGPEGYRRATNSVFFLYVKDGRTAEFMTFPTRRRPKKKLQVLRQTIWLLGQKSPEARISPLVVHLVSGPAHSSRTINKAVGALKANTTLARRLSKASGVIYLYIWIAVSFIAVAVIRLIYDICTHRAFTTEDYVAVAALFGMSATVLITSIKANADSRKTGKRFADALAQRGLSRQAEQEYRSGNVIKCTGTSLSNPLKCTKNYITPNFLFCFCDNKVFTYDEIAKMTVTQKIITFGDGTSYTEDLYLIHTADGESATLISVDTRYYTRRAVRKLDRILFIIENKCPGCVISEQVYERLNEKSR